MVFVHVFVHGTKEIINILVISLIQSELHSLIIRGSLVQAQVGPHNKIAKQLKFQHLAIFSFTFLPTYCLKLQKVSKYDAIGKG